MSPRSARIRLVVFLSCFGALLAAGVWWGEGPTLLVVGGLFASIVAHELGHFVAARSSGIRTTKFFIGFGPTIWSFRRGEMEYGLKLLPIGGFVAITGMHSKEEVDAEHEPRTFRQASYPRKVLVLAAGPAVNILLCVILLFAVYAVVGAPTGNTSAQVVSVVSGNGTQSPAQKAGLRAGDVIVKADGIPVDGPSQIVAAVRDNPGRPIPFVVRRGGHERSLTITPSTVELGGRKIGQIGVTVGSYNQPVTKPVTSTLGVSVQRTAQVAGDEVAAMYHAFGPAGWHTYSSEIAGPAQPTSSSVRLTSPVGLVRIASQAASAGVAAALVVLAVVNVALGIVNLLPLPPLDGGQIVVATYERVRSRKGKRYAANPQWVAMASLAVVLILVAFSAASMWLDIVKPTPNPFG
jgi:membrane-associated protease RseP (regulator of RpoE activity)